MRKRCLFAGLGLFLSFLSASAQNGFSDFERISLDQGLSQTTIFSIAQDKKGFLWFGTQDGLNRFDGYSFRVFRPDRTDPFSLADHWINSLFTDQQGRFWVGTFNSGLQLYEPESGEFKSYLFPGKDEYPLVQNRIWSLADGKNGHLWVGTDHGLQDFDPKTGNSMSFHPGSHSFLQSAQILTIYSDSLSGNLWIGSANGLTILNTSDMTFSWFGQGAEKLTDGTVLSLFPAGKDKMWVGTANGLNLVDAKTGTVRHFFQPDQLSESKTSSTLYSSLNRYGNFAVRAIVQDKMGWLWMGTDAGLIHFQPETGRKRVYQNNPSNQKSLSNDLVRTLWIDKSENLWIGTAAGGLNRLDLKPKLFRVFRREPENPASLSDNNVRCIFADEDGTLWIGTLGGGLNKKLPGNPDFQLQPLVKGKPTPGEQNVWSVWRDHDGFLWAGTSNGLSKLGNDKSITRYLQHSDNPNSLVENTVRVIREDKDGHLLIGTEGGLSLLQPDRKTFQNFTNQNGLSDNTIYAICPSITGKIWIGTNKGLNLLDPKTGSIQVFLNDPQIPNSLSNNTIRSLFEDEKGVLWVGTNHGLNRFNQATQNFTSWDEQNGLLNSYIYGIQNDKNGNIWVSTNLGIMKISPDSSVVRAYTTQHGLQSLEFNTNASFKSADGKLFFGGISGFNSFFPDSIRENRFEPAVVITAIKVLDKPATGKRDPNERDSFSLPWSRNFLTIEFAALDFTQPENNQFEFSMEGVSNGWVRLQRQRFVSFTNLDPGTYTLMIRATNHDGVWTTQPKILTISITPPFWMTTWFRITAVLLLVSIVLLVFFLRLRNERKQKQILEQLVLNRTAEVRLKSEELAAKNNQLVETLDQLQKAQLQLVQSEKMASVGQMTAGLAHEMNNPLNFISSSSVTLKKDMEEVAWFIGEMRKLPGAHAELAQRLEALEKQADIETLLPEINDLISAIDSGASRTAAILKDLRKFTRLDENVIKKADIHDGLNAALDLLNPKISIDVDVIRAYDHHLPQIDANHGELNQVYLAVFNNALDAMPDGGTLTIHTEKSENMAKVTVSDTGNGIPADLLPRIFEPFFTTKPVGSGQGLGLAVCFSILKKHGGTIEAKSSVGSGTTIIIQIPLTGFSI